METIWLEKEIKGQCTGGLSCNGGCCRVRTYSDHETYIETFCEHYATDTGLCKIYENRYEGCKRFPTGLSPLIVQLPKGCGYYIE